MIGGWGERAPSPPFCGEGGPFGKSHFPYMSGNSEWTAKRTVLENDHKTAARGVAFFDYGKDVGKVSVVHKEKENLKK